MLRLELRRALEAELEALRLDLAVDGEALVDEVVLLLARGGLAERRGLLFQKALRRLGLLGGGGLRGLYRVVSTDNTSAPAVDPASADLDPRSGPIPAARASAMAFRWRNSSSAFSRRSRAAWALSVSCSALSAFRASSSAFRAAASASFASTSAFVGLGGLVPFILAMAAALNFFSSISVSRFACAEERPSRIRGPFPGSAAAAPPRFFLLRRGGTCGGAVELVDDHRSRRRRPRRAPELGG